MSSHGIKEEFKYSLNFSSVSPFREEYIIEEAFRRGVMTVTTTSRHLFTPLTLFLSFYKRRIVRHKTGCYY